MNVQSVKLVYFSPTGSTKAVVQGITRGINQSAVELIDITRPEARKDPFKDAFIRLTTIYKERKEPEFFYN